MKLPERHRPVLDAAARLAKAPLYLVGGALRDAALGREPNDLDLAYGGDAAAYAASLASALKGTLVTLDDVTRVYRVALKEGPVLQVDVAEIQGRDIAEDLARRDFDCNALALPLAPASLGSELIDPRRGLLDLGRRVLRASNPKVFREDPLRLLRAFRQAAQLGFKIDPAALRRIRLDRALLRRCAGERVRSELMALLSVAPAHPWLRLMDKARLLSALLPELEKARTCALAYYGSGGVLRHTLDVVERMDFLQANLEKAFPEVAGEVRAHLERRHGASAGGAEISEEEKAKILQQMREQVKAEHDKVVAVGGLHVLGTERHESRRVDNQLRGRSGRQGDPGSSRFYVSLEDDLMRIFGENRLIEMVKAQILEGEVIEMRMMTHAIESAQKRVEMHNFEIRKRLLEYDNVMNRQREVIYKERRAVLEGRNLKDKVLEMVDETADGLLTLYAPEHQDREEWNFKELADAFQVQFGVLVPAESKDLGREELLDQLKEIARQAYEGREKEFGPDQMRRVEQWVMLQVIDSKWKDHLYGMDHLREGIGYRVYGQQDPLVEYQHEAYQMFTQMVQAVRAETVELIFKIQAVKAEPARRVLTPTEFIHPEAQRVIEMPPQPAAMPAPDDSPVSRSLGLSASRSGPEPPAPFHREEPKVGRNDPCPCGSNKKFKKCHGT